MLTPNQRGQSLIQVLTSLAIMSIITVGFLTMMNSQHRETQALGEKLAALDLERTITMTIANQGTCSAMFADANLVTPGPFDATNLSQNNPRTIELKNIPANGTGNVISLGGGASTLSNSLAIPASSGIQVRLTSLSAGELLVNFDQSRLIRPIAGLRFPLIVSPDGSLPVNATKISGCGSSGGATDIQEFLSSGTWTKPASGSMVRIQCWGAGGGGQGYGCGGGGGGGYNEIILPLSQLGQTETVTIGAGGVKGSTIFQPGTNGGNSKVGTKLTAYGGAGGQQAAPNEGGGPDGPGGSNMGPGLWYGGAGATSGPGGNAVWGAGGGGGGGGCGPGGSGGTSVHAGAGGPYAGNGIVPGGGGGGAANGASGKCILTSW